MDQVYQAALKRVPLSGPTNFNEVIHHVVQQVQAGVDKKLQQTEYHVLLILTDGAICDVKQTTSEIISASALPMSIIIVGVGNADFGKMEKFDGDDVDLTSARGGRVVARDIVQFVPFRDFDAGDAAAEKLAAHVLAELPDQFLQYMCEHNITPGGDWVQRYTMPPGDWYSDTKVTSRDLDFSALALDDSAANASLSRAQLALSMLNTGVDADADASPDTAIFPEGYVDDE